MSDLNIMELDKFNSYFEEHHYSFKWLEGIIDTNVALDIPSLKNCEKLITGDWGPMLTIKLLPTSLIKVTYLDNKTSFKETYNLEEKSIQLKSPMLKRTRDVTPFYFEINDSQKELKYKIFVNYKAEAMKVEVYRNTDGVMLSEISL